MAKKERNWRNSPWMDHNIERWQERYIKLIWTNLAGWIVTSIIALVEGYVWIMILGGIYVISMTAIYYSKMRFEKWKYQGIE